MEDSSERGRKLLVVPSSSEESCDARSAAQNVGRIPRWAMSTEVERNRKTSGADRNADT